MRDCEIQDGTWTQRIVTHRSGVWRTIIFEPWVTDRRFRRARFVLVGGPTVLVPAEHLRRVVAKTKVRGRVACPLRVEPGASTINKQKVQFHVED
jgi:hypothetical protein